MDVLTTTIRFCELRTLSFNFLIIQIALKYSMGLMLKPERKIHFKELGVDGGIILKSILENTIVTVWSRIGTKADCYSNRKEPYGFRKIREIS